MNGSKHISNCYSALQGLYWMSYGAIYTFAAVFLLDRKFTDSQVGTLIALACVFSAIFQPFAAAAADRGKRFSLRSLMTLICLLTIAPMVLLFFFPQQALSGVCYVILMLLHLAFQPLLSALGMQLLNNGYYLNFGAARGIGSMSYAVLAFFLGSLTLIFGLRCLPVIGSLLYLLIAVLLQAFPETKRSGSSIVSSRGTVSILRENHRFAVLCLGIILIFISHSAINTYMIQILQKIGKGNQELGQVMAYTAILEFFVMVGFSRFVKGRDCGNIMRFTAIFFVLKAVFVPLAPNLPMIYAAFLTQIFSFALFTPASVYYANAILPAGDKVKGQAMITIAITMGNIAGSFLCGNFITLWGITAAILVTAGIAVIGLICFFLGAEKTGPIIFSETQKSVES